MIFCVVSARAVADVYTWVNRWGQEEAGIDGGGLFKEFLTSLSKEAFDTDRGLWLSTSQNELYPNPHSYAKEGRSVLRRNAAITSMAHAIAFAFQHTNFTGTLS